MGSAPVPEGASSDRTALLDITGQQQRSVLREDRSSRQFAQDIGRDKKLRLSDWTTARVTVSPFGASQPVSATVGGRVEWAVAGRTCCAVNSGV